MSCKNPPQNVIPSKLSTQSGCLKYWFPFVDSQTEDYSYVGEVVKVMDKSRVLVKANHDEKLVVQVEPEVEFKDLVPSCRVALRSGNYAIHKILPDSVDPMVNSNS